MCLINQTVDSVAPSSDPDTPCQWGLSPAEYKTPNKKGCPGYDTKFQMF